MQTNHTKSLEWLTGSAQKCDVQASKRALSVMLPKGAPRAVKLQRDHMPPPKSGAGSCLEHGGGQA